MLTTTWGRGRGRAATRAARAATVAIVFAVAAFASTGARAAAKGLQGAGNGRMGASSGGAKIKRSSGMKRSGAKVDLSGLGGNGGLDLGALLSGGAATAGGSGSRGGSGSSGGLRPHSGGRAGRGSRSGGRTCAIECPLGKALEVNAGYEPYANGCGLDGMPIDLTGGRFDFTPCCDKHDYCYQECGATQKGCDATFGECLRKLCKDEYGGDEECTKLTKTYEMGVGMFGCGPFKDSQRRACKCPELSPAERTTYAAQLRAEAGPSAVPRGKYCGSKSLLVVNVGLEAEVDAEAKTFHLKAWNEEVRSAATRALARVLAPRPRSPHAYARRGS